MIVSFIYGLVGLGIAMLPPDGRARPETRLLSALWVGIGIAAIALYVALPFRTDVPWAGNDQFIYQWNYAGAGIGMPIDFEPGFSALTALFAMLFEDSRYFFLFVYGLSILLYHAAFVRMFDKRDIILVWFLYFNFFALYAMVFNTIRQGLAIGMTCVAVALFLKGRTWPVIAWLVAASTVHVSAIFALVIFVTRLKQATVPRLVAAVCLTFAMSMAGVTEAVFNAVLAATGIYPRSLLEYSSSGAWQEYGGGANRIDFLVFSLFPLGAYIANRVLGRGVVSESEAAAYERLAAVYTAMILPFSFFAYLTYTERFVFPAWFLIPIMLLWPLVNQRWSLTANGWRLRLALLSGTLIVANFLGFGSTVLLVMQELVRVTFG